MYTPINFYSNQAGASIYQSENTYLSSLQGAQEVDSPIWSSIFKKYAANTVKIVIGDENKFTQMIGTGQWINPNTFITAAHNLEFFNEQLSVILHDGRKHFINMAKGYVNADEDWAVFYSPCPYEQASFPSIALESTASTTYGMIFYHENEMPIQFKIGQLQYDNYLSYQPMIDIEAGKGSSGAILFNEKGEACLLHLSRKQEFATIRNEYALSAIFEHLKKLATVPATGSKAVKTHTYHYKKKEASNELEHGFFTTTTHIRDEWRQFPKKACIEARNCLRKIVKDDYKGCFDKIFQTINTTLYQPFAGDPHLDSLRIDAQKPTETHLNIHIQFGNMSMAAVLIPKSIYKFAQNESMIKAIISYSLGKLISLAKLNEESNIVYVTKIDFYRQPYPSAQLSVSIDPCIEEKMKKKHLKNKVDDKELCPIKIYAKKKLQENMKK